MGDHHNPPIRELQRVVMPARLIRIDLAKAGQPIANTSVKEKSPDSRILFKGDLRSRQKAHRNRRLVNRGEASRKGPSKPC